MKSQNFVLIFLSVYLLTFNVSISAQANREIEIIRANSLEFDQRIGADAKRLIGNVVFKHDEVFMFCDSAYFYDARNYVEAFNNVRIVQGDSILLTGHKLFYDGNSKLAQMRDSVILKHHDSFLITDSLDYDRNTEIGYYFEGGKIFDGDNRLISRRGYYHSLDNIYYAVDSVELRNPDYTIFSDSLKYEIDNSTAFFFGPTHIISDDNYIYCENGFYDTENDIARFSRNAWLRSGQNILKGDSLNYYRGIKYGEAFQNVSIIDTVENLIAKGNYAYYYEEPSFAMLTDSVEVIYHPDNDSTFLSSDTVYISVDSLDNKLIRAFYHVQVYKSDFQLRCDSLVYSQADSIAELFGKPIIWSEESQITADFIEMHIIDDNVDYAVLEPNPFIIEQIDTIHFNQIKGRKLIAYFEDNNVYKVEIFSNSQTLYYLIDENTDDLIALNNIVSGDMTAFIKNNEIENIWFYKTPEGQTIPIKDITNEQMFLDDFIWHDFLRPKSRHDIFFWKVYPEELE